MHRVVTRNFLHFNGRADSCGAIARSLPEIFVVSEVGHELGIIHDGRIQQELSFDILELRIVPLHELELSYDIESVILWLMES